MICYHHNDLDGRCAGAIVLKKFPKCRMREVNYNDAPQFAAEIGVEINPKGVRNRTLVIEDVFIVDFSFKPKEMQELLMFGNPVTWIDHHKTAEEYGYDLPGLRDFTEPGLSGCELTWNYLFPETRVPDAVRLIGDYDTWQFKYGGSMAFQFGLRSKETSPDSEIWLKLFDANQHYFRTSIVEQGASIISYKDNHNKALLKHRYEILWEDHNCLVVNTPMIDSTMFEEYRDQFDICLVWWKTANGFIVSLRSNGAVDVSEIAKRHGGGGHKAAAGFVCEELPF